MSLVNILILKELQLMEASGSTSTRRRATKSSGTTSAKTAKEGPEKVLDFELDKETKGAVRFAEVPAKGEEAYVRTFYMRKELWQELGEAEDLELTITAVTK
jgi:hypothetical protein